MTSTVTRSSRLGQLSNLDYLLHIRYLKGLWFQVTKPFCLVDLYVTTTRTIELSEYLYPWTFAVEFVACGGWVIDSTWPPVSYKKASSNLASTEPTIQDSRNRSWYVHRRLDQVGIDSSKHHESSLLGDMCQQCLPARRALCRLSSESSLF